MAKTKEELQEYLKNEHVQWFLYNILSHESDSIEKGKIVNYGGFNQGGGGSSAFGAGQFIGSTRKEVIDAYGVDAWSDDLNEQLIATIALLDMDRDLDKVARGDFENVFGVSDLKENKKGEMLGGSRWQAFYPKGHRDYVKTSKNLIILGARPEGWKNKYNTQLSTAVYDPKYSWDKILTQKNGKKIQQQKIELYNRIYSDSIPDSLSAAVPQILAKKEPNVTEGLDMDTTTAVGNQTQTQDPTVITPTITPGPIITDLPTRDQWMESKSNEIIEQSDDENKQIIESTEEEVEEKVEESTEEEVEEKVEESTEEEIVDDIKVEDKPLATDTPYTGQPEDKKIQEEVKEEENKKLKEEEEALEAWERKQLKDLDIPETVDVEVMNSNGDISTVTTPAAEVTDSEDLLDDNETVVAPETASTEEEVVEKPVLQKPKARDFNSSRDYMRARMNYYKQLESEEIDQDDSIDISDEDITDIVSNQEEEQTPIDASQRSILNNSKGNDLFKGIIGNVDKFLKGISSSTQSTSTSLTSAFANNSTSTASTTNSNTETTVTGGGGVVSGTGPYQTKTTTTGAPPDIQGDFEPIGETVSDAEVDMDPEKTEVKKAIDNENLIKAREQERAIFDAKKEADRRKKEIEIERVANLTGNLYESRSSMLEKMDFGINKSTIETLALQNPDVLNIEDGVVTDNNGNSILTKDDWLNFASKPKDKGGLGFKNGDVIYNNTSNQFKSDEYKGFKTTQDKIDGAYEYFKSSFETETGDMVVDFSNYLLRNSSMEETIDFGKYENAIKREILNEIPLDDIEKYFNEEKSFFTRLPIIESMSLKQKENLIANAKTNILNDQVAIIDNAFKKLKVEKTKVENEGKNLQKNYDDFINLQETTRKQLGILREKHGEWAYGPKGDRVYIPRLDSSKWPDGDQESLSVINQSIEDIEGMRAKLVIDQKSYQENYDNFTTKTSDLAAQQEQILRDFKWNETTRMFDPEFKLTSVMDRYNEFYADIPFIGKPLNALNEGIQGYAKFWIMNKAVKSIGIVKSALTIGGFSVAANNNLLGELFPEYGPYKQTETNKGYTHTGQFLDGLLNSFNKSWGPKTNSQEAEWMIKGFESKKETWGGRAVDTLFGEGSNMSFYSGAVGLARMIPYVMMISQARFASGAMLKKGVEKLGGKIGNAGMPRIGDKIVSSLNKSKLTSDSFAKVLEMNKINYRITLLGNIADGRAQGLNHADSFTYGNALTFVTGLTQSIMPDYKYVDAITKSTTKKAMKEFALSFVKGTTNKTMTKLAREKAMKKALPGFLANFTKEQIEEFADVGGHDIVKSMYIAGHSPEIYKAETVAEVFRATTMLTIPLAGLGSSAAYRNTRATVFNEMRTDADRVVIYGQNTIKALKHRISNLKNTPKDAALREILQAELSQVENQKEAAEDIRRAINAAPEMVTDTQLALLIEKQKLLDKKAKLKNKDKVANEGEFKSISEKIDAIDVKIRENTAEKFESKLYARLLKNTKKLAGVLGVATPIEIDTSTEQGKKDFYDLVELKRKQITDSNKKISKEIEKVKEKARKDGGKEAKLTKEQRLRIEELQEGLREMPEFDGPGLVIYNDATGKHEIFIKKDAVITSKNYAVALHELLHVVLRETVLNNPNAVKSMSYMLRQEILKNPQKYKHAVSEVVGKFDQYKKATGEMSFDEMFTVFTEALAQGQISYDNSLIGKISDFIRRILREFGLNFQIEETDEMVNFLRDFHHEVMRGRFSRGMKNIFKDGRKGAGIIGFKKTLITTDPDALEAANQMEKIAKKKGEIKKFWNPKFSGASMSIGGKPSTSIYKSEKIKKDLQLSENTKQIVEENKRLRDLILEENLKDGKKIVASEDLQNKLVENNLPAAIALAKFAAKNPNIMGLEAGKRVTYEQFLSGYYLELSNLARTYDASVNEFGQYLNTILPVRYGGILEAEKKGAVEGDSMGMDFVPDSFVEEDTDLTPDDISSTPKVDTAKRLGLKDKTKPFVEAKMKKVKKLIELREQISEQYSEETENMIAELESQGIADLTQESITVKKAPNLLYKFTSELFGIDQDKLNPKSTKWLANLRKNDKRGSNEVRAAQRAVVKHAQLILSTVFNEGHTAAFKSSGMPNSLLKFGYNKGSKRIKNNFPQYKKPNLSEKDLLEFVGVYKVKGGYEFKIDRNTGTKLIAIASMVDRNMSLQAINESLVETGDITAKVKYSLEDGLSNSSKSIYYRTNINLQPLIQENLPSIASKIQVLDVLDIDKINDIIIQEFEGTKVDGKAFAKSLTEDAGIIAKYKDTIERAGDFKEDLGLFMSEQLEQTAYTETLLTVLKVKVKKWADLYTDKIMRKSRSRVGQFVLDVLLKEYNNSKKNKAAKKRIYEQLFMLMQQHTTAAKAGNGRSWFLDGTNETVPAYHSPNKKTKDGKKHPNAGKLVGNNDTLRYQLFGSEQGAPVDFAKFINTFLAGSGIELGLTTKQNNDIKRKYDIDSLTQQKSKNVIESLIDKVFNYKQRYNEAMLARELTKMQVIFYAQNKMVSKQELAVHMATFGSNMGTSSRRAAYVYGIQKGLLSNDTSGSYIYGSLSKIGKDLEFEHGKPHLKTMVSLLKIAVSKKSEKAKSKDMDLVFVDYVVNIITKKFDNTLTSSGVKNNMFSGYTEGTVNGWVQRLYNTLNFGHKDISPIISLDGKNTEHGTEFSKSINVVPKSIAEINIDRKISDGISFAKSINYNSEIKGITVLDFDDTLATSKSNVLYTAPDGTQGKLTAEEFAKQGADLLEEGYVYDFSEFSKVVDGKTAPLFNKAMKLQGKFGPKNMFVLTARPADSAPAIYEFLKANGLNIPLKNITGLANSTPEAKALWMAQKVGEGYNDFYFADDALQNVQAVKNVLEQFDVKSKIQQAKVNFSKSINTQFNDIIEQTTGESSEKRYSRAKARVRGEDKGKYNVFIPPSAEDFVGLIYSFLSKGKLGEKQFEFFKKTLFKPLNKAYDQLNAARQAIANDYKKLQEQFPNLKKNMYEKLPGTEYTYGDAIRVYLWDKAGFKIPGLTASDKTKLVMMVENDSEMKAYAETLSVISRSKDGYVEPTDNWQMEDIRVDLMNSMSKIHRKKFFAEFLENAKIIFSEENLNKIEAIYGTNFREALVDMLYRIENGTNRSFGSNRLVNRFMNWINGSIGTTMFFNSRSAVLQTLSTVNFINWQDNNVLAAAKAFANQGQFWADFSMIFNSTFLKQRRSGTNIDINASELSSYVSNSKTPIKNALNWLLQKGFLPTQMMDSFAIAMGGASFYRNRVNKYLAEGMTIKEAEEKSFLDMQGIAEETQQSARPDKISQQQASVLGRLILAFQNTPMQYARLMKKAILDLKDGRGDAKANISKIIYYGAVQNMIFYTLQTALFAMMFGDDDDEEFFDKKKERVLQGSIDSVLRGMGVGGAVVSTVKNMGIKLIQEQNKPRHKKDENALLMELLNLSPPIGIKARQIQMGTRTINWNKDAIEQIPMYNLENPAWEATFNYTQALTNVPLARMHTKVSNLRSAANKEHEAWQRIALLMGWTKWNIGVKSDKKFKKKKKRKRLILR